MYCQDVRCAFFLLELCHFLRLSGPPATSRVVQVDPFHRAMLIAVDAFRARPYNRLAIQQPAQVAESADALA